MQIEWFDLHFALKKIGIIEAISWTNTDNSVMDCDARAMWHNNRTSSENLQNIIDHITTFTYHIISSICISQCITSWLGIMVQQVLSVTSPKYCFRIHTFIKKNMSISAASWVLSETSSLQFHSNILPLICNIISSLFIKHQDRHMHIFVTKWCIVWYLFNALWALWDGSIKNNSQICNLQVSTNMEFLSIKHIFRNARRFLPCEHIYIYIHLKKKKKSKIRAWYVFN